MRSNRSDSSWWSAFRTAMALPDTSVDRDDMLLPSFRDSEHALNRDIGRSASHSNGGQPRAATQRSLLLLVAGAPLEIGAAASHTTPDAAATSSRLPTPNRTS